MHAIDDEQSVIHKIPHCIACALDRLLWQCACCHECSPMMCWAQPVMRCYQLAVWHHHVYHDVWQNTYVHLVCIDSSSSTATISSALWPAKHSALALLKSQCHWYCGWKSCCRGVLHHHFDMLLTAYTGLDSFIDSYQIATMPQGQWSSCNWRNDPAWIGHFRSMINVNLPGRKPATTLLHLTIAPYTLMSMNTIRTQAPWGRSIWLDIYLYPARGLTIGQPPQSGGDQASTCTTIHSLQSTLDHLITASWVQYAYNHRMVGSRLL